MEKLELRFTNKKETKNTVRYQEELGDEAHSSRGYRRGHYLCPKRSAGGAGTAEVGGDY